MGKKTGCLKLIGCVFAAIVVISFLASIGEKDDDDSNKNITKEDIVYEEENNKNAEDKNISIDETTYSTGKIYSNKKCVLKLVRGDENGFSIEISNKSKKDYSFDIHSMSINGIMTNCNIYTATTGVPSNKKAIMNVEFENEWLDGIENIEYIDLIIWAYNDAESMKDFETDIIRIKTDKFSKEKNYKKEKGVESNGLIVKKEKLNEETLEFSVINKDKSYIEFDFGNSSINGWALDDDYLFDAMSITVYPNSKATISIDISELVEKNNIENVSDAEFSLKVRDKGDYFKEKTTKKIKFKNK